MFPRSSQAAKDQITTIKNPIAEEKIKLQQQKLLLQLKTITATKNRENRMFRVDSL